MNVAFAHEIANWRYDPPYALYNLAADSAGADEAIRALADPSNGYFAVTDEREELVAFRCFGVEARVAGGDYSEDALDTGGGLRPDLTGRGLGLSVLQAGLSFGTERFHPIAFRVTVAAFNQRALRVCERAGFHVVQGFRRPSDGLQFAVLVRHEGFGAIQPDTVLDQNGS